MEANRLTGGIRSYFISFETNKKYCRIRVLIETISDMTLLSRAEELLLLAVWKLNGQAYGATIREFIVETTDEDWSIGVIYSTLDRLARQGYVTTRLGAPTAERGGRSKRYFDVSGEGAEALNRIRCVQNALWSDLPDLALITV